MNFNSYYLWPKKFVEDNENTEELVYKPFVEDYVQEILNNELYDLEEEELKERL